jgi:hypothetical protein
MAILPLVFNISMHIWWSQCWPWGDCILLLILAVWSSIASIHLLESCNIHERLFLHFAYVQLLSFRDHICSLALVSLVTGHMTQLNAAADSSFVVLWVAVQPLIDLQGVHWLVPRLQLQNGLTGGGKIYLLELARWLYVCSCFLNKISQRFRMPHRVVMMCVSTSPSLATEWRRVSLSFYCRMSFQWNCCISWDVLGYIFLRWVVGRATGTYFSHTLGVTSTTPALCTVMFHFFIATRL